MHLASWVVRTVTATAAVAGLVAGCTSDDWTQPRSEPTPLGTLGPRFTDPAKPPPPEGTLTPEPGSWADVRPPKGYRVVLVTAGDDDPTQALVDAVDEWADDVEADLRTIVAENPGDHVPSIDRAVRMRPDLVIGAGSDLVDALSLVTPHHLSQQFLVLGAELAEPTTNVTAVNWAGATFRGADLSMATAYDPESFTTRRCADAVRAGVAAVLHDVTGIVVRIS